MKNSLDLNISDFKFEYPQHHNCVYKYEKISFPIAYTERNYLLSIVNYACHYTHQNKHLIIVYALIVPNL